MACLQRHHVDPSHFELEILESISLSQVQLYRNALEACQRFGLKLALDDFGTGASILLHLQSVPAQSIKIDQTFVRQLLEHPNNGAIVASLVSYARFTSRTLIAEGVENHDIQKKLIELGAKSAKVMGLPIRCRQKKCRLGSENGKRSSGFWPRRGRPIFRFEWLWN